MFLQCSIFNHLIVSEFPRFCHLTDVIEILNDQYYYFITFTANIVDQIPAL